jgi:hypothetical protein
MRKLQIQSLDQRQNELTDYSGRLELIQAAAKLYRFVALI